jgi:hypothetical protein
MSNVTPASALILPLLILPFLILPFLILPFLILPFLISPDRTFFIIVSIAIASVDTCGAVPVGTLVGVSESRPRNFSIAAGVGYCVKALVEGPPVGEAVGRSVGRGVFRSSASDSRGAPNVWRMLRRNESPCAKKFTSPCLAHAFAIVLLPVCARSIGTIFTRECDGHSQITTRSAAGTNCRRVVGDGARHS